jgi:uncharacterized protein (DUF58 family)
VSTAQISTLLSNRDLDRLARLRLNASRRFTNRARGEHLAAKGGTSTEFCDFRDYSPGDDVRFVDWNIFARINRPYLKQYHQEEEMHIALLVDASTSMTFEDKLPLALRLAAAFGVIGLRGSEKVSVCLLGRTPSERLAPCSGRASLRKLFSFVEGIEAGGDVPVEAGIEDFLRQHSGRGVAIVLSDFLTPGDLRRAFNLLFNAGLEPWALQILGPTELAPEVTGDFRLVDSETAATLDISNARDLLALYHEYRTAHQAELSMLCRQRSGRFLTVSAAEPFERVCFETLRRKGWVE